jgi:hypothetical protein
VAKSRFPDISLTLIPGLLMESRPNCIRCQLRPATRCRHRYCRECHERFVVPRAEPAIPPDHPFAIEREQRVRRLSDRAAGGLPLFEDL